MNRCHLSSAVLLLALLTLNSLAATQTTEEAAGRAAEQAGKLREALSHYVAALQSTAEGTDEDQRLREKIIKLVLRLDPPPAVPDETQRFMARGQAAVEIAKGASDLSNAISEFQKAARLAPWWADVYYNLGAVQEKAERYSDAIRSFRLYLLGAPKSSDAKDVQSRIFKLEYKQEQSERTIRELQEQRTREEEQRKSNVRLAEGLVGDWHQKGTLGNPPAARYRMQIRAEGTKVYATLVSNGVVNESLTRTWEVPCGLPLFEATVEATNAGGRLTGKINSIADGSGKNHPCEIFGQQPFDATIVMSYDRQSFTLRYKTRIGGSEISSEEVWFKD